MNKSAFLTIALLLTGSISVSAFAQEISELQKLLPQIGVKAIEEREAAQKQWETITHELGRPGNEEPRAAGCKAMAAMLEKPTTKPAAKQFILLQLQRIGGEEVLETLANLITSENAGIRDATRRAVANNSSPVARILLAEAFDATEDKGEQRKLINAIGFRRDAESAEFLTQILSLSDPTAKRAAADALVAIVIANQNDQADADAMGLLRKSGNRDALLRMADQFAAKGNKKAALAIFRPLAKQASKSGLAPSLAAYRGLLDNVGKKQVVELVVEGLNGDDKLRRQIATARIRTLPAEQIDELGAKLTELPTSAQTALLTAIGTRPATSEPAGKSTVLAATKSEDANVRLAAIRAFRRVGDASTLPQLMTWMNSDGDESAAAKSVLQNMSDPSIDGELAKLYKTVSASTARTQLLDLLNSRRAVTALPIFVSALQDTDTNIRDRAFAAISRLGTANEVAPMLAAVVTTKDKQRDQAEKQIVNLCRRIPDGAEPVVAYFNTANAKTKSELMPLLGRIGDAKSLETIRTALSSNDADQNQAAVAALANWPDHQVASDLKSIVESTKDAGQRIRALRGLARVCVLGGSDSEKLDYLKFILSSATRNDEKVLAMERAKAIRTVDSLNFVLPHLEDADLGDRACRTVIDLAHHRGLREPNRAAFEPALKKVQSLMKDERQLERVRKYLANE